MPEPIPFFGWFADYEETEAMLREQINTQQSKIKDLEKIIVDLLKDQDIQLNYASLIFGTVHLMGTFLSSFFALLLMV